MTMEHLQFLATSSGQVSLIHGPEHTQATRNLHVRVTSYGTDLGVAGSLANALATYAAATERWEGKLDTKARDMAAELVNRAWYNFYCSEGKGVVTEEARADYKRFFEQEVYVPAGWSGTMPNGDKIQPWY